LWPETAEHCRSQDYAYGNLTQNGRLPDFLHQFRSQLGAAQKNGQRREHRHHIVWIQMLHC
jgi:hypothetical protein